MMGVLPGIWGNPEAVFVGHGACNIVNVVVLAII
jgi:hypothetical protein